MSHIISLTKFPYCPFTSMAFLDLPEGGQPFYVVFGVCFVCFILHCVEYHFYCIYSMYILFCLNSIIFPRTSFEWVLCDYQQLCLLPDFSTKKTIKNGIFISKPLLCAQSLSTLPLCAHTVSPCRVVFQLLFSSLQCS